VPSLQRTELILIEQAEEKQALQLQSLFSIHL
jgi:hypothetical protein